MHYATLCSVSRNHTIIRVLAAVLALQNLQAPPGAHEQKMGVAARHGNANFDDGVVTDTAAAPPPLVHTPWQG